MDKKREDIIIEKESLGYNLIQDTGSELIFRKKFNWWIFALLTLLYIIPGVIYIIVHYNKAKLRFRYKKE